MSWDDGKQAKVKKVQLTFDDVIYSIQVTYDGTLKSQRRGSVGPKSAEFTLGSDEYITALSAYGKTLSSQDVITALTFSTNKKTYGPYGKKSGYQISVPEETGKQIAGFLGTSGNVLNFIDVHYAPLPSATRIGTPILSNTMVHPKKLEAKGGETGAAWDDGPHNNVKKVYVGKNPNGVGAVKFEYANGSQVVFGDEHGKKTLLGYDEFEIDADDSIVYVEGYRAKVNDDQIIKALIFKTYKGKSSQQFGTVSGTKFVLQGGRIVGFHGRSTDVLISLGAYISSSSTRNILGKWTKVEQSGKAPGLRCSHAIAHIGNKIYSFGGEFIPNHPIDKDLYVFDLQNRTWSISPATGDVPHLACLGVRMVSVGSTLYVFGGRDASRKYNGFYSFDTTKNEWKLLTPVEKGPAPRSFHSMAADENHVYVFGGVGATKRLKTLDAYNIAEKKWVQCSTPGDSFSIRGGSGLHVVEGKVWVIYGFNNYEIDDVYYYDLVKNEWTKVETFGEKPSGRSVFASAVVGKHIVIFGGEIDMDPLAHVGPGQLTDGTFALNTETLVWEKIDKLDEEQTPEIRGWAASTAGTIDGKKGLVMHGGKAQTNNRFEDLCFFGVEHA